MKRKVNFFLIASLTFFAVFLLLFFKRNSSGETKTKIKNIHKVLLLPGSPVHFLRIQREKFANLFVFGDYDSSSRHIVLSNKRIFEAEGLRDEGRLNNSINFFLKANEEAEMGFNFMKKAAERGEDVNYLKEEIKKNLLRQQKYLENLKFKNLNFQKDDFNIFFERIREKLDELTV
ncbi:hypothetical protein KKA69_03650 [Patescibacteria group bacterium]|nr:hypothetical protein [Patescibacteria group bacterium]